MKKVKCDFCNIEFEKFHCKITKHNFCTKICDLNYKKENQSPKFNSVKINCNTCLKRTY